ncbi:M56 family metallopeptidase [Sphingomonas sp. MG17]|uniref:M56 family metallopeptidase n=1 Tax=Sphingomonas tagetis TaxID=2949092 RepID=A0A9X2KJ17_9SPHN|nr:M56 family metallopeptidase [Sphingomonas tagetis]MCP3728964.1 M56 family metallopeptidase [Sphingomonas tagetis]
MIAWILETFVATTVLMLLVLALRKPVSRYFGPSIAYALWLLPVIRLALPPLPDSWRATAETPVAAASEVITYYFVDPLYVPQAAASTGAAVEAAPFDWLPVMLAIWAAGALAFLGYHLIVHRRFCANLLRRARVERTVAEGRVHVIETEAATGPLAFGIWRKYVAFPRDFNERYDPLERNLALAHELGHHLRGDLIANWIALVVLALHWFNPVAWRAFRAFRADQEMACDALVLAGRAPALRHAYGRAIVKSAHGGAVSAACHLHTINELKGRLRMLSKHDRKSRTRVTAGVTGAAALTLAGLALTASGTQAAANLRADVGEAIGVDLQEAPAAPEAPAAAPAPVAPAAPKAPEAKDAPKVVKKIRIVTKDKDGKITITEDDAGDMPRIFHKRLVMKDGKVIAGMPMADMPEILSARCGGGKADDVKIERKDGDKRKIIICTDRIEARAADGAARAEAAEAWAGKHRVFAIASADMGKRHAMLSLKMARKSIEAQDSLSAAQKSAALKGIDDAIRELEATEQD